MSMPSDAFLKNHISSSGGALVEKLPELEAEQAAALEQGEKKTLAELAQAAGLFDEAKLGELAQAEAAKSANSAAQPTPSKKTSTASVKKPSASKTPAVTPAKSPASTPKAVAAPAAGAPAAKKPTDSAVKKATVKDTRAPGTAKTSKPAVPTAAAAEVAAAAEADAPEEAAEKAAPTPSKKQIAAGSKKGVSAGKKTPSSKKPVRGVPEPAPGDPNQKLMIIAGVILAMGLIAAAVIFSSSSSPPPVIADGSNAGGGNSGGNTGTPGNGGNTGTPGGGGAHPVRPTDPESGDTGPSTGPDLGSLTPEEQKEREDLQERAGEIVGLAHGDEFSRAKALKMISVLETSASKKNMDIVRKTKAKVNDLMQAASRSSARDQAEGAKHAAEEEAARKAAEEAKRKADEDAAAANANRPDPNRPAPQPSADPLPPPNPSLLAYQEMAKKLYPALAAFDFDKAKKVLADAPELDGAAAKDLDDDKASLPVLQKLCDYAGAPKAWKDIMELEGQSFVLANGTKISGTLKKVDNNTLTVFMAIGGEQEIKVQELVSKDFLGYARKGCPKEERGTMFAGRGLADYYAGDLDGAKKEFDDSSKESGAPVGLITHFVARIARDRLLRGGGSSTPPTPSNPNPTKPGKDPADPAPADPTPADPSATPAPAANSADIATLKEALHGANVLSEAGGKMAITYNVMTDSMKDDFVVSGANDPFGNQNNFGHYGLYFGISQREDANAVHCLSFKGDFDWTIEFLPNNSINDFHALAFLVDVTDGAKKQRGFASFFGQTLEKIVDGKQSHVGGDYDPRSFGQEKHNTVRFVRKGESFIHYFGGGKRSETKLAGGEARFGVKATGMPFWITKLEMHGTVDMDKLKK